jgi:hypothetical protein
MLNKFTASNGVIVEYSPLIYSVSVLKDGVKTDFASTLIHSHFDEGVFRNALGSYDRDTRKALKEFLNSIGITEMKRGRKDGRRKQIK